MLNSNLSYYSEEYLNFIFNQLSQGKEEFDFEMFENAKLNNPRLFDFLEQPGNSMRDFLSLISQKKDQQVHLTNLEAYNNVVNQALDKIEFELSNALAVNAGGFPVP